MLPLLVLFIYFAGPVWFTLLVTAVSVPALYELYRMGLPESRQPELWGGGAWGAMVVTVISLSPAAWGLASLAIGFILFAIVFLLRFRDLGTVFSQLGILLLGFLYISLLLAHLPLLHSLPGGRDWVFLVLLVAMAGDTCAYFCGINFGRHRLYPAVSPKKSIEGAVGGLAGSLAGAWLAKIWFLQILTPADTVLLGLVLGAVGQLGDLFESLLKRSFGVKDSGGIIPGHGGILDRLDSLLFVFPFAYYYALLRFGG